MTSIDPNMGLRIWDQLSDKFDHDQLALNWQKVGAHDHSEGQGVQIPSAGLANGSVTESKLAAGAVTGSRLGPGSVSAGNLVPGAVETASLASEAVTLPKLAQAAQLSLVPVGLVLPFAGAVPPSGWLFCNGAEVSNLTYNRLWQVIGITYGGGSGPALFKLPDLRGKTVIGVDTTSGTGGTDGYTLGETGGEEVHHLTQAEMPSHTHAPADGTAFATSANTAPETASGGSFLAVNNRFSTTAGAGSDVPHNNMQPFLTLNYIIKY